jgi:[ribosomal protein S5]-alanine N-acetyltransferase
MNIPFIETPQLILRPWSLEDAGALYNILQEPGILEYFPPQSFSEGKTEGYIEHHLKHWQEKGYGHWAVTLKGENKVVGWNGLEYLPETDETEVGYLLSHRVWGRGLASEAAQEAVRYGFKQAGLQTIIGLVHPANVASIRVLEKCGLEFVDRKVYWGLEMCRYRIEFKGSRGEEKGLKPLLQ